MRKKEKVVLKKKMDAMVAQHLENPDIAYSDFEEDDIEHQKIISRYLALHKKMNRFDYRRFYENGFYLLLNVGLMLGFYFVYSASDRLLVHWLYVFSTLGILSCVVWWHMMRMLKNKFHAVREKVMRLEKHLPIRAETVIEKISVMYGKNIYDAAYTPAWMVGVFLLLHLGFLLYVLLR